MQQKTFDAIVKRRLKQTEKVLTKKGLEYGPVDRLHNFKVAARIDDETPEEALWGMFKKHLVSVMDMIKDPEMRTPKMIDEKLGDAINYVILLEAVFKEKEED